MTMSAREPLATSAPDKPYEEVRKAWHAANVRPLWENPLAHKLAGRGPKAHLWKGRVRRPLVGEPIKATPPAAVERRVLSLVDPAAQGPTAGPSTTLPTALQVPLPGGAARPHRHTMN